MTASLTLAVIAAWSRSVTWPARSWGACGLTAGLGGVRWLMIDGASPSAIAGLIALAMVGLSLSVHRRMSQRRPAWARALIILSVTLGVAIFVGHSRQPSRDRRPSCWSRESTPNDLGLSAEVVRSRPRMVSNRRLVHPGHRRKYRHPEAWFGETAASVLPQAAVLVRHGFGVLLADARGHGFSAGEAMDFGWYGDRDISAALDYLLRGPRSIWRRWQWSECRWAGRRP